MLGIPANQASFHLRQLAKFGLVEEDPAAARDKRDRVWRAAEAAGYDVSIGEVEQAPGGKAASAVFRRTKAAWAHQLVEIVYGEDRTPGIHRAVTEQAVRLTKDEASQLTEALVDVVDEWRQRNQGSDDDGRRTYHVFQMRAAVPRPTHRVLMPARLRIADPAEVSEALARVADRPEAADLRLLTKHFLAVLEQRAPGHSVEVRVPPYAAVQVIPGVRHTRGTPPAVVETDAETWIALATGDLSWVDAVGRGARLRQRGAHRPDAVPPAQLR